MSIDKFEMKGKRPVIVKDPNANLDYTVSFEKWMLAAPGDTISTASVPVVSGGISVGVVEVTANTVKLWVSGGTVAPAGTYGNAAYASATVRIVTVAGRVDDRTIYFKVRDR